MMKEMKTFKEEMQVGCRSGEVEQTSVAVMEKERVRR